MADLVVELPEKLLFLLESRRYKVAYGGRGSGKSWSFARALILQAYSRPLRVLCTREVQKSIKESVKRLLDDQIEAMGLGGFFESLETEIRGRNGSVFVFAGLANHTVESIKSYEGIDRVWIEEAQTVSKKSLDILTPTIRKPGSEIWVSFNPELDSDEVWKRFVEAPPPDCTTSKVNWSDNPWFPEVLEQEREHCKVAAPDDYRTIWEGECRPAVQGAIYASEIARSMSAGRICNVPYDPKLKVHCIWDLGWNDAMSIILVQKGLADLRIIGYVEDSFHTLDYYVARLRDYRYNWGEDWIPHDGRTKDFKTGQSAEEILKRLGRKVRITPNIGIENGIKAARMIFDRVYFDKTNAERLVDCLKRYRRAINSQTNEPGSPVHDEFSHGCLDGGTLVKTLRGDVAIRDVVVGDYAWTPAGFARISAAGPTKIATEVIEIELSNGHVLIATPEHPIFTINGVVAADTLRDNDEVIVAESAICCTSQSIDLMGYRDAVIENFKESATGFGRREEYIAANQEERRDFFMLRFIKLSMGNLHFAARLGLLMGIYAIHRLATGLSAGRLKRDEESIQSLKLTGYGFTGSQRAITKQIHEGISALPSTDMFGNVRMGQSQMGSTFITGMAIRETMQSKIWSFFPQAITRCIILQKTSGSVVRRIFNSFVKFGQRLLRGIQARLVASGIGSMEKKSGVIANGHESCVKSAESRFSRRIQRERNTAIRIVALRRLEGEMASRLVYDLTVEKHHCYLANGVLVSNCDSFRYLGVVTELLRNEEESDTELLPVFSPHDPEFAY